jgi:predicted HicB family RNase H-like nuclease
MYTGYTEAKKACNERYLAKFAEIRLRTTPEEKKAIEKKAKAAGKSVNKYIKDIILKS